MYRSAGVLFGQVDGNIETSHSISWIPEGFFTLINQHRRRRVFAIKMINMTTLAKNTMGSPPPPTYLKRHGRQLLLAEYRLHLAANLILVRVVIHHLAWGCRTVRSKFGGVEQALHKADSGPHLQQHQACESL